MGGTGLASVQSFLLCLILSFLHAPGRSARMPPCRHALPAQDVCFAFLSPQEALLSLAVTVM